MEIPATLAVTDNVIQMQQCAMYRSHRTAVLNAHHVCPESWFRAAGKPVETPLISLCPTCHANVHTAIDGILRKRDVSRLPRGCVALARKAFALADQFGVTPAPTL